jgi:hypothetical protein
VIALLLLIIAAHARSETRAHVVPERGIDLVVALDVSVDASRSGAGSRRASKPQPWCASSRRSTATA